MSVYNLNGESMAEVYDLDGSILTSAFDIDGRQVLNGLSVMTYNVQRFGGINAQQTMQNAIVNKYKVDIIGLQELGSITVWPDIASNMLADYPYKSLAEQTNKTGIASKIQFIDATSGNFTNQGSETRGYNKAHFSIHGKTVCWINTHLELNNKKYDQMSEILAMANQEEYVIITGDFNSFCLSTLDADYIGQYKQFVDAGYHLANCSPTVGFTKTYTDKTSATSLEEFTYADDSIITSSNIDIVSVVFDTTKLNYLNGSVIDHIPVIAYLKIN